MAWERDWCTLWRLERGEQGNRRACHPGQTRGRNLTELLPWMVPAVAGEWHGLADTTHQEGKWLPPP